MNRRSVALVVIAGAGFAVLMLAASAGSVRMWHDPPPGRSSEAPRFEPQQVEPVEAEPLSTESDDSSSDIIAAVFAALMLLVALAVGWAIVALLAGLIRNRRRRPPVLPGREVVVLPEDDMPVVELDVQAQLAALAHGSPRNAIVACWLRLEDDVAAAGLPRHVAETSAEFTTRVLASYALDPSAVIELAALYREARFSRHPLGQPDRDRALVALRSVHSSLAAARTSPLSVDDT
jgi:hypothetical protein